MIVSMYDCMYIVLYGCMHTYAYKHVYINIRLYALSWLYPCSIPHAHICYIQSYRSDTQLYTPTPSIQPPRVHIPMVLVRILKGKGGQSYLFTGYSKKSISLAVPHYHRAIPVCRKMYILHLDLHSQVSMLGIQYS